MRTWLHRTAWSLLLIGLAVAAVRLAVIAGPMETGWETVATTFRGEALGWTGWKHTPISGQEPPEQAEYWLRKVDEILAQHPESAELCMGAAWVLDSPGTGFYANHITQKDFGFGVRVPDVDYEAIQKLSSQFETRCRNRCLQLAKRATELEPDDIRWWRMRAQLLFVGDLMATPGGEPRDTAWREVLNECSQHDPDNALYDCLAAQALWNKSAEVDRIAGEDGASVTQITINDNASFEEGSHRFEAGQKKSFLAVGESGYPAIAEFLSQSRLSKVEQGDAGVQRGVAGRQTLLFGHLWRRLDDLAEEAKQHSDNASRIAKYRQKLRLFEQAIAPEETSAMYCSMFFGRFLPYAAVELQALSKTHPDLIEQGEVGQLTTQAQANLSEAFILQKAVNETDEPHLAQKEAAINQSIVAMDATMLAVPSLVLAGVFLLAASFLDRQDQERASLGFTRHSIAWTLGIALSLILFGLMPAKIISPKVQTIVATIFAWGFVLATVGYIIWKAVLLGKQRRFQYRILTLLACMTALAVFGWIWPVLADAAAWFRGLPADFQVPAQGWSGFDAATLHRSPELGADKWRWALCQWNTYAGPYLALAFSLVLVALWSFRHQARKASETVLRYWCSHDRVRWSGVFRSLGTSALTAGLCALLVSLWLLPVMLRVTENQFQYRMQYCRNPADRIARIYEARSKVLASEDDMAAIRAEVEHHFARARNEITISDEDRNRGFDPQASPLPDGWR